MQPSLTNNRLAERMSLDVDESLSDHDIPIAPLHLETINYPASPRTRKRELFKESSISSGQSRHSFFSSPRRLGPHKKEEDLVPSKDKGESTTTHKNSSDTGYHGCLNMTMEELEAAWIFPDQMPVCTGGISDSSSPSERGSGSGTCQNYTSTWNNTSTFEITDCLAYSNLWLWDLALTCDNIHTLKGCKCEFASNLYKNKQVQCATSGSSYPPPCPDDCKVCQTCMTLLGCDNIYQTVGSAQQYTSYLAYLMASALGVLMGVTALLATNRRWSRRKSVGSADGLPANLIQRPRKRDSPTPAEDVVWLAPIA